MEQKETKKVETEELDEDDYDYLDDEEYLDEGEGGIIDRILGVCPITAFLGKAVDQLRNTIEDLISCNK